ncbi:hypothetical protein SmJEL517_g04958 [Synchytrium microbalum]|uniref:Uncharacterized protein n=1 Tax=Synchytrium microbalum TaxID=1806994 RepID=A0A507C147_9FUNG|nr:uncharacterized protein SmJEL517_g04958 [Synchytrium microbalum]TPX31784.1 hypothetical protein SmJEL517_g04958 [Synchytrium microbalum]
MPPPPPFPAVGIEAKPAPSPTPSVSSLIAAILATESPAPSTGSLDLLNGTITTPLNVTIIQGTPAIRQALPSFPLIPKSIQPYLLPIIRFILPVFHELDCTKEFWIESAPGVQCATLISARILGMSVVLLGWASKLPQIISLLSTAKARMDLPLIPTIVELFGWTLIALYNVRIGTFWTAFGEGFGIIVTNIFLMILWGLQQLRGPETSYMAVSTASTVVPDPNEEAPRQYSRVVVLSILSGIAVFYVFAYTVLWGGPIIILQGFLGVNAPLGLVPVFTLMYGNYVRKRADSIPGLTIIMGWLCGFIRSFTSFVETTDILMRIGCVAGLILPGILVWQVIYYEYICGAQGIPNPKKAS